MVGVCAAGHKAMFNADWGGYPDKAFLSKLDNNRKLTDAEAKQMDGLATFLSESHYRVDTKENVHLNKSLY